MMDKLKISSASAVTYSRGFTIVELLIVIVVIGILAALVLNSFSSSRLNALNAQTAHAIEAYKKGLIAYAVTNGAYPNYTFVCLGEGYPGGTCWTGIPETPGFSSALKTTMGNTLPLPGLSTNANGALFISTTSGKTLDSVPTAFIQYRIDNSIDPNLKCVVGPIVSGVGDPNFLTSNPVGPTSIGGKCYIPLPDATKL